MPTAGSNISLSGYYNAIHLVYRLADMKLRLALVILFSVLEAESLIPGLHEKSTETYDWRRTRAPVSCPFHGIATSDVACFSNREFAWKTLIPATVCGKALKNGGLGKMEMWKLRQINKFNNNDLEFEVLSSGALYGHTLILATGCAGTALFTFIVLFICYRVLNCGRQIRTLLYDSEDELCGCFSNGKRKNHRRHRMTKDSSSSSAVIQMASLSSPVKMTSSLVDSASPTPRSPGHFSFNEEDLRVGYQLMESLHKVDEADGESQGYVTEEKTNHEGPGGELDTDALLVKHHQHQDQDQLQNTKTTKIQNQQPPMLSLRPPPEERQSQSQSQAQQPQETAQATEAPATAPAPIPAPTPIPSPTPIPAPTPIPSPTPTPEPTTVLTSASASASAPTPTPEPEPAPEPAPTLTPTSEPEAEPTPTSTPTEAPTVTSAPTPASAAPKPKPLSPSTTTYSNIEEMFLVQSEDDKTAETEASISELSPVDDE